MPEGCIYDVAIGPKGCMYTANMNCPEGYIYITDIGLEGCIYTSDIDCLKDYIYSADVGPKSCIYIWGVGLLFDVYNADLPYVGVEGFICTAGLPPDCCIP